MDIQLLWQVFSYIGVAAVALLGKLGYERRRSNGNEVTLATVYEAIGELRGEIKADFKTVQGRQRWLEERQSEHEAQPHPQRTAH